MHYDKALSMMRLFRWVHLLHFLRARRSLSAHFLHIIWILFFFVSLFFFFSFHYFTSEVVVFLILINFST